MSSLREELAGPLGSPVASLAAVPGGSINDAYRAKTASGMTVFVKTRSGATVADFESEAAGLGWLADAGVRTPRVVGVGAEEPWLALEWIEPGPLSGAGADELGRELAALHRAGTSSHGALPPAAPDGTLRLGSVEIELGERGSWAELYGEGMLRPLLAQARAGGRMAERDLEAVDVVCDRVGALAGPAEPPSRLHGDLWDGNVMGDAGGQGWLIDPAAYGGHREVDLAMLELFGASSERLFAAYEEAYPLAAGHEERMRLWQIAPLLVHAILFGGSYGARAGDAARRYL